jgi:hypothetical protein
MRSRLARALMAAAKSDSNTPESTTSDPKANKEKEKEKVDDSQGYVKVVSSASKPSLVSTTTLPSSTSNPNSSKNDFVSSFWPMDSRSQPLLEQPQSQQLSPQHLPRSRDFASDSTTSSPEDSKENNQEFSSFSSSLLARRQQMQQSEEETESARMASLLQQEIGLILERLHLALAKANDTSIPVVDYEKIIELFTNKYNVNLLTRQVSVSLFFFHV